MRFILSLTLVLMTSLVFAGELTTKDVEQWLTSAPELQAWLEKQEHKLEQASAIDDNLNDADILQQAIQQLKQVGVHDELEQRVKQAKYESVTQWLQQSQQISLAYMALVMQEQLGERSEIEQQLALIEAAEMPEDDKEMMRAMLNSSLAMFDAIVAVSEADKAAVQPYLEQLTAQIEE